MTTSEQLDPPWPGDETDAEWQERRAKLLAALTDDGFEALVSGLLYNTGPGRWVASAVLFDLEWWLSENDREEGHEPLYAPTHWMPLPDPPEPE